MQFEVKGIKEFEQTLLALQAEFGSTAAKRSLIPALRKAVSPAKDSIKAIAPVDTGRMKTTVRHGAKVATQKDKKRKYLNENTVAFGYVDVGVKYYDEKGQYRPATEAREFGTAEQAATPFIRRGFQKAIPNMLDILKKDLGIQLETWASKQRAKR
jgi:HK97 gp10 family phage protein